MSLFFSVRNIQRSNGIKRVRFKLSPLRDNIWIVNFSPFTKNRSWDLNHVRGIYRLARANSNKPCCLWNMEEFSEGRNYWCWYQWRCAQHAYIIYKDRLSDPSLKKRFILQSMVRRFSHVLWLVITLNLFPHLWGWAK